MDILPAIDLREGKCVRLLQGDYDRQIDYADDPTEIARAFEAAGASWIHVVDLDGARDGKPSNLPAIEAIRAATSLKLEVGGGLREVESIETLFSAGVQRCVVGTKALEDWSWFARLMERASCARRIAIGLDARDGKLAVKGWTDQTDLTAVQVAERVADMPVAALIYTDISRDGMLLGPNIEAIRDLATCVSIPVIASGGVTDIDDVRRLARLPLAGMIIGRALYEKQIDLSEAIRIAS